MIEKLKNRRGETLLETLLSVLIAALAILMFSNTIAAAIRSITNERSWTEDINQLNAFLEEKPKLPSTDLLNQLKALESGTIILGDDDKLKSGTITITGLIADTEVNFYICNYGNKDVISYAPAP